MEEIKTSKILTCNNIKPPVDGKCGFFVKRKQRYCKMLPAKGNKYCAEHLCQDQGINENFKKRINCPLDPKHTVFEDQLEKHLKRCNATKKKQLPYYFENINLVLKEFSESEEGKIPLHLIPVDEMKELVEKIQTCYNKHFNININENIGSSQIFDEELNKSSNGPAVRKHLLQQASLVNLLHQHQALRDNTIVIEFGAGRGALSHWIQKAMSEKENTKFLLVDRQSNRNRLDCYHKGEDQGPNFERLNIDIQHLCLGNVTSLTDSCDDVVAVGKHLCGGATDLSLKCLTDAAMPTCAADVSKKQKQNFLLPRLHSILFALCCYHRCTWSTYVGHEFFTKSGFTPLQFSRMAKMAAWSTCGFGRRTKNEDTEEKKLDEKDELQGASSTSESKEENKEENEADENDGHGPVEVIKLHVELGLSTARQIEIGQMCKRLIDLGRICYLSSLGYKCELVQYISTDITPENVSLLVTRS